VCHNIPSSHNADRRQAVMAVVEHTGGVACAGPSPKLIHCGISDVVPAGTDVYGEPSWELFLKSMLLEPDRRTQVLLLCQASVRGELQSINFPEQRKCDQGHSH